ncbi:Cytochrome c2 [Pseudomonas cichorii]|uniref:Cytochrome c2 n=1 Tax=Pseudomonas cichorii TaxID=36746 RepID=A0A3M4LMB8_PSECI|nr:c-type cytochrome [Pseudomonas cichorii]RMQ42645.1 Cytochrome c2 [Pseudomonas cichorii]
MKKTVPLLLALLIPTTAQAAGDAEAGKAVFTGLCAGCHKIGPSARSSFGPPLTGIIGRQAAQAGDYKYTPQMQASGIVWTREKLSAFIQAPGEVVPGTRMKLWWRGNDQRMEDLLEYLEANK